MQYQQRFQYQPMDERNEQEDNMLSDIITKMLNLNDYMTEPTIEEDDGSKKTIAPQHIEDIHFDSMACIKKQKKASHANAKKKASGSASLKQKKN